MERRTNAASDQTKYALAVALKELMAQKPIDKITIHDLTERCGIGREHLKRFFEADIHAVIHRAVEEVGEEVGAVRAGIKKENMDLMTHFDVVVFAGMIESWLLGEIDRTPEELIAFADTVL